MKIIFGRNLKKSVFLFNFLNENYFWTKPEKNFVFLFNSLNENYFWTKPEKISIFI